MLAAGLMQAVGVFALGVAFVLLALNAMRVGLLTRFMGVLGIIVGVLFIIPLGSSLPIVQAFWLSRSACCSSAAGRAGMPPAWVTGEAQPWPTQQELREARLEQAAPSARGDERPRRVGAPRARRAARDAGAASCPSAARTRRRRRSKRKRR